MTYSEFEKWFPTYITGVYHQKPHRVMASSPKASTRRTLIILAGAAVDGPRSEDAYLLCHNVGR